jgi:hypothetical protein
VFSLRLAEVPLVSKRRAAAVRFQTISSSVCPVCMRSKCVGKVIGGIGPSQQSQGKLTNVQRLSSAAGKVPLGAICCEKAAEVAGLDSALSCLAPWR